MSVVLEHRLITDCPFALVNPFDVDRDLWVDLPHHPLSAPRLSALPGQLPVLVDLLKLSFTSRLELVQRAWDWKRANERPLFCGFIKSTEPVERMVRHLGRRKKIKNTSDEQLFLRFYDPRVFEHLCWIFTPAQLASLMGPAEAWYWPTRCGEWQKTVRPELKTYSLILEPQQLLSLGRISILNRILKNLHRREPSNALDITSVRQIESCLRRALDDGLSEAADLQLYVFQALQFGAGIHRHPTLANALQTVRMGHSTYVGACLRINDEELHHSKEAQ